MVTAVPAWLLEVVLDSMHPGASEDESEGEVEYVEVDTAGSTTAAGTGQESGMLCCNVSCSFFGMVTAESCFIVLCCSGMITVAIASTHFRPDSDAGPGTAATAPARRWARSRRLGCQNLFFGFDYDLF